MNIVFILLFLLGSLWLTVSRGAGYALVYAYLPALLLFSGVTPIPVPGLPDPSPPWAVVYGSLCGALLRLRTVRLRLVAVDYLVILLLLAYVASSIITEHLYTGISTFGSLVLSLIAPYFIARISTQQRAIQRQAVIVLCACMVVIAFFALIESRLWPNTYDLLLTQAGLRRPPHDWGEARYGYFRARASLDHPIDLGVSSALIAVMITSLALRCGIGIRSVPVRAGLGAALVGLITSLSFTPFLGVLSGIAMYTMLSGVPLTRRYLVASMLAIIAFGFFLAYRVAHAPISEFVPGLSLFDQSLVMRQIIIKKAWEMALAAGPFGWGFEAKVADLESLDNAYLLIAIERGWVTLSLWLAIFVALAALVSRVTRRRRFSRETRAMLIGFCGMFGTMISMCTVWLGFIYHSLLIVVIALTVNAAQATAAQRRRVAVQPSERRDLRHPQAAAERPSAV